MASWIAALLWLFAGARARCVFGGMPEAGHAICGISGVADRSLSYSLALALVRSGFIPAFLVFFSFPLRAFLGFLVSLCYLIRFF